DRRARAQGGPAYHGGRPTQKNGAAGKPRERRELLHRERPRTLSIAQGCRLMKLARSTYYYRSRRQSVARREVEQRTARLCAELPRYGYRRITAELRDQGWNINHKAVARIMRERGLQVRPLRRFVRTTNSDHKSPIFPDLAREFTATGADQLWVADITYI